MENYNRFSPYPMPQSQYQQQPQTYQGIIQALSTLLPRTPPHQSHFEPSSPFQTTGSGFEVPDRRQLQATSSPSQQPHVPAQQTHAPASQSPIPVMPQVLPHLEGQPVTQEQIAFAARMMEAFSKQIPPKHGHGEM